MAQIKDLSNTATTLNADDWLVAETAAGVDRKITFANFQTDVLADQEIPTNNARLFDIGYMLYGNYLDSDMVAGAILTGTNGNALVAGQIVLRNYTSNKNYNGIWVIQPAGSAVRYSKCNTSALIFDSYCFVKSGDFLSRIFHCITYPAIFGTNDIDYQEVFIPSQALETDSDVTFDSLILDDLTASELIAVDSNKKIVSLPVATYPTVAELAYVKGLDQTLKKADTVEFGIVKSGDISGGNYSEFEADGTLKFNGDSTVYKDVIVPLLYKGGAGEATLTNFVGGISNLLFDKDKFVYIENAEAPHDWKEGSEIELHLHWSVKTALSEGDKVNWQFEFAIANMNNGTNTGIIFCDPATPTVFGTKTITKEYTSPVGGTPAGTNLYTSLAVVSATDMDNIKIGAGLIGCLTRIAKTAGGAEAANGKVFGLNLGIHYQVDTIGSRNRGTK